MKKMLIFFTLSVFANWFDLVSMEEESKKVKKIPIRNLSGFDALRNYKQTSPRTATLFGSGSPRNKDQEAGACKNACTCFFFYCLCFPLWYACCLPKDFSYDPVEK